MFYYGDINRKTRKLTPNLSSSQCTTGANLEAPTSQLGDLKAKFSLEETRPRSMSYLSGTVIMPEYLHVTNIRPVSPWL
jgi:hypothetical protein